MSEGIKTATEERDRLRIRRKNLNRMREILAQELGGRCLWNIDGPKVIGGVSTLEMWTTKGLMVLFHIWPGGAVYLFVEGRGATWTELELALREAAEQ